ncbi:MAG: hypothetical protein ACFB5Z_14695 [Elainellaceae cyanobacterium]
MNVWPEDLIENIDSPESFLQFVKSLEKDARMDKAKTYPSGTHGWENGTIVDFLEAIHAWGTDADALPQSPSWRDVARLLLAGKSYQ